MNKNKQAGGPYIVVARQPFLPSWALALCSSRLVPYQSIKLQVQAVPYEGWVFYCDAGHGLGQEAKSHADDGGEAAEADGGL